MVGSLPDSPCSEPLCEAESIDYKRKLARLKELERFWYESCQLLLEIRDQHLYRARYADFESFCRKELGMGKSNYNRRIQTGQVAQLLATNVAKPEREAHVRPLLRLTDPDQQVEAYRKAVAKSKTDKKPFSAVFVTRAVREIHEAQQPPREPKPADCSNAQVMTQISRSILRGLEKLTMDQLMAFEHACQEFKAKWLRDLAPEPPDEDQTEPMEEIHGH